MDNSTRLSQQFQIVVMPPRWKCAQNSNENKIPKFWKYLRLPRYWGWIKEQKFLELELIEVQPNFTVALKFALVAYITYLKIYRGEVLQDIKRKLWKFTLKNRFNFQYKCQYCDRRFSDFGSRIKHERTHTGEASEVISLTAECWNFAAHPILGFIR